MTPDKKKSFTRNKDLAKSKNSLITNSDDNIFSADGSDTRSGYIPVSLKQRVQPQ